ncbi:retrovirus-related pol polyprotein from transposon TNT 1-94, partial [Tanacetum coccineum]
MRYVDTKANKDQLRRCIKQGPYKLTELVTKAVPPDGDQPGHPCRVEQETYANTTLENIKLIDAEAEAIHMILNGICDDIYSTVDACSTAREMWRVIKQLQQGQSINKQDVKTKLFWEFGKFTLRDKESIESYYSRFYKMMNAIIRNKLKVDTMQVNVQFLQQLQPKWSRFVTIVKQQQDLDTVSYHRLFDILKQHQNEVNEIRAEKIARNSNPLTLVVAAQHYPNTYSPDTYYQAPKPHKTHISSTRHTTSTNSHATTRNKNKEIVKPITPPSESASEENSDPEQAQRDKDMQKNLALIAKNIKNIYKPTNNSLRTSSNNRNKIVNTSPRSENDRKTRQLENQRTVIVDGDRETVGNQVVQQTGIQCFNCKEYGHFAKECRKPKRVKDYSYHKEKMMLCKQEEKGVPLSAEQSDWLQDTDEESNEQELEAHNMHMAKIYEVLYVIDDNSRSTFDIEPLEHVPTNDEYNVFTKDKKHSGQPKTINDTYVMETVDSNVIPNHSNMCNNEFKDDQNGDDNDEDERVELATYFFIFLERQA